MASQPAIPDLTDADLAMIFQVLDAYLNTMILQALLLGRFSSFSLSSQPTVLLGAYSCILAVTLWYMCKHIPSSSLTLELNLYHCSSRERAPIQGIHAVHRPLALHPRRDRLCLQLVLHTYRVYHRWTKFLEYIHSNVRSYLFVTTASLPGFWYCRSYQYGSR